MTSDLLAVLFGEPDAERYEKAIAASECRMSVVGLLEAAMFVEGRGGAAAGEELDAFIETAGIELATVTAEQAPPARRAWRRFGKGDADGDYRGFSLDLPVIYGEMPPGPTVRRGRQLQAAGCGAPPPSAYRLR